MQSKTLLLLAAGFAVGYLIVYFNVFNIQPFITEKLELVRDAVAPTFESIKANPVPVLLGAVPAAIAVGGLASKAYSKLETSTAQSISESQSQVYEVTTENQLLQQQNLKLQDQLNTFTQTTENSKILAGSLQEAQTLVSSQRQEINRLHDNYRAQIQALNEQIERLKLTEKIVVK